MGTRFSGSTGNAPIFPAQPENMRAVSPIPVEPEIRVTISAYKCFWGKLLLFWVNFDFWPKCLVRIFLTLTERIFIIFFPFSPPYFTAIQWQKDPTIAGITTAAMFMASSPIGISSFTSSSNGSKLGITIIQAGVKLSRVWKNGEKNIIVKLL